MKFIILLLLALPCQLINAQTFLESSQAMGINHEHIDGHIMGGGAAFFDFNNDGFEDLYITGGENRDQLFENNQNGAFTEVGILAGIGMTDTIKTVGVITGDLDNDGDREIFVTTSEDHNNLLFLNNGDGTFTNISISAGFTANTWSTSSSFGDYDNDGFLDLYVGEYVNYFNVPFFNYMSAGTQNTLYHNEGNMTFTEVAVTANVNDNGGALSTAFTDYDNDNDVDLLLGNDFGDLFGGNGLFRNDYPSTYFTDISVSSDIYREINAMGIAVGDFDEDLYLDYYVTNMMENLFHENNGDQTFNEVATSSGTESGNVVSWGTFFFDYDNDTYLDLFCASGGVMTAAVAQQNVLYANQQNGSFLDVTVTEGMDTIRRSRGAIYGDIDNDGALEVVVVNVSANGVFPQLTEVYKSSTVNNWIEFRLQGISSNRDGFGSHIRLVADGRTFLREIGGGSSYLSQNSSIAHFGLDQIPTIDSVIVTWPGGNESVYTAILINQRITLVEDIAGIEDLPSYDLTVYPNPAKKSIFCSLNDGAIIDIIEVYSMQGDLVLSELEVGSEEFNINLEHLPASNYQLIIRSGNRTFSRKITTF
ncbi:MAG: FG-GAP-like repeat-containing protein [Crocinitomicaceae bacterium]|nr:FG-GAP-like repeat-containing protein [Crocinitomicaceae bacterium]